MALKRGRPRKWESVEDLKTEIDGYLASVDDGKSDMPTKAGLALHLGCHRDTLSEYVNAKGGGGFSDTIKRAYAVIEDAWAQRLSSKIPVGAIFYLKAAFRYKDRIDHTTDDKPIKGNTIILSDFKENEDETVSE